MEKNLKNILNKILNSPFFILLMGVIIFLKIIFCYKNTIAMTEALKNETLMGTFAFTMAFATILCILPNRIRFILTIFINFVTSIILISNHLYYEYSSTFISIAQFKNIQYQDEIIKTVVTLVKYRQILYFIDLIIIFFLICKGYIKIEKKIKSNIKIYLIKGIVLVISLVKLSDLCEIYVEKGGENVYNKDMQMREATIFGYYIYDFKSVMHIKDITKYKDYNSMKKDYDELKEEYNAKYSYTKYKNLNGVCKDKNIIILQMESLQDFIINKKINGTEITPNLNKFFAENIRFNNMFMQSYSTTADSEHSTITSLYPMENGMAFNKYFSNTYDDIFKIFKNSNYFTSYMHGNYAYFWNRGNVYSRLNLNNLSLKEQFYDVSEDINSYLSDELLYRQAVDKIKTFNNPFISYIISASSHTPFTLEGLQDRSKIKVNVGKYKGTGFGNYLEAANYADYAFGVFIEELKKAGLYEDTVILVFGDHNGLTMYEEEMIDFFKLLDGDVTDVDLKLNYIRVLGGLKIPGVNKMKIEKTVSKLDIKPTLAYLCGIDDGFSLGTNIFESKDFIILNNERIVTQDYYFDENWYEIKTGNLVNYDSINEETKKKLNDYYENMKKELDISNSIIVNNLLK